MESRASVTDKQPKFQQSSSDPVSHLSLSSSEDPLQWPKRKKWPRTMIVISMSLTLAYYSGVYAAAIPFVMADYHCSNLVATSGISWFLLGFACGPLVFAPLSEMFGRNPIILVTLLLFILSNIGSALAPNVVCHLIFRYIAGFFGAPTGMIKSRQMNCSCSRTVEKSNLLLFNILMYSACSDKCWGFTHRYVASDRALSALGHFLSRQLPDRNHRPDHWRCDCSILTLAMV